MNLLKKLLGPSRKRRILVALQTNGEMYGLQMRRALGIGATIYNTLRTLEDDGLVASRVDESAAPPERGGFLRRIYRITPAGQDEIERIR